MKYFYVICPVGSDPKFHEKKAILEALGRDSGIEPLFPLERYRVFSLDDMKADIKQSEFVLSDLSMERPSCYFELGIAQTLGAHICVIAAAGTHIHQTAGSELQFYYSNMNGYRKYVSEILARHADESQHS